MGIALWLAMMLAACSSPPTGSTAPETPASVEAPAIASPPVTQTAPAPQEAARSTQVDASRLPEDVRDFVLKQRMCRHFSRPETEGGNPAMAGVMCAGADEAAWKVLVRKYQGDDAIASVLLAERPPAGTGK